MAYLKRIRIEGYRSIKRLDLELGPLNIVIGANGAGKSNLISFFKMLNEMMAGRLQEYIGRTGGAHSALHFGPQVTPQIVGSLEFHSDDSKDWYDLNLSHAAGDTLIFGDESLEFIQNNYVVPRIHLGSGHRETRLEEKALAGDRTALKIHELLNQCRVYHFHDTSATSRIRQSGYVEDNRWLQPDAGNLATMLYFYSAIKRAAYDRIVSAVRIIVPEFADFDLEPSRLDPKSISLNWRQKGHDYLFGPHQISDGSLRAIALCTLLLAPEEDLPKVIIIDEPELGLHPQALEIIAGLMRAASVKSKVIAATQSPSLLNHFEPSEIITVESRDGESKFQRLDSDDLKDWLEDYSIGELWQRNVLGAGPIS